MSGVRRRTSLVDPSWWRRTPRCLARRVRVRRVRGVPGFVPLESAWLPQRARRAVSSPMPPLPPITTTVCPRSPGSGWMGEGCDAHDSSVQHPRLAFASRKPPARRAGLIAGSHRYSVCPAEGAFATPRLFHPWKRDKSPAFHASRSPGVPKSQSGRISLVTARRSCQRSMTDGRPQNQ